MLRAKSLLLGSVLLLTACYPQVPVEPIDEIRAGKDVTSQELVWESCDLGFECTTVVAPLNWVVETGEYLTLSLIRPAGSAELAPILVNPGGPGASGVDFVRDNLDTIGTSFLRENFQLIGFDPRGVGESAPVTCVDSDLKDQVYYGQSPYEYGSDQDLKWTEDLVQRFADSCQSVGFDVSHFNTQQSARDMDLIRELLGLEVLDYLGYSYGTELGATYAALFPDRVGKFVLDGAADPTISTGENLLNQVAGFDAAFKTYLVDCLQQAECPFVGDLDQSLLKVADFLEMLETKTLPTQFDREVGVTAAIYGIIAALYSEESWPYLTQALSEAFDGDASTLMMLADFYNDRDPDGGYLSNINEANIAIGCADSRVRFEDAADLAPKIEAASAVFGKYFASPELSCVGWPEGQGKVELDFRQKLGYPPLVVGTTGDPATPFVQAQALSEILDGAKLLTFEGEGHTAYGSNPCVNEVVDQYLSGAPIDSLKLLCP